jgi:hypothetical protein
MWGLRWPAARWRGLRCPTLEEKEEMRRGRWRKMI